MNKIKIIIMLIASIIVVAFSLIQKYPLEKLSYTLLLVVVLFYVVGTIIQYFFKKIIKESSLHNTKKNEKNLDILETEEDIEAEAEVEDKTS